MSHDAPGWRSAGFLIGITLVAALLVAGLCALGVWQVRRLAWKETLIARVDARVHAAPAPAPRAATSDDAYRRVAITGRFLNDRATLVQAATVYGSGYWVIAPLVNGDGIWLVNRGFVSREARATYARPSGSIRITGLLRLSEPGGGFLRRNDPAADRWFSRDVDAIAAARRLPPRHANYFIDADAGATPDMPPISGLTVVHFPNNHLVYAITWFALAMMVAGAYILVMRHDRTDTGR